MKKFQQRPGFQLVAHKLALDPGAEGSRRLMSHTGAARAAYNWAVGWVTATWWQRGAEQSYGIGEDRLTPWRDFSLYALRKAFNEAKHTDPRFSSWWEENSKEAYNTGLANASAAFTNYAKSKSGKRKGRKMGIPRFKTLRRARRTCRFTTGVIRIEAGGRHITLPRLGTIRLHEHRPDLVALVEAGELRILSATVRLEHERWFVSLQVEQRLQAGPARRPDTAVGIDLGVRALAVYADSDGTTAEEPNPRHLDAALKQLRRTSRTVSRRQGPDRRTGQKASKRWEKANTARNKVHHRVANLRADTIHKLTTRLAAEYGTVVVEDLNVAGMLLNRRLARQIADAAFGEIRRQLTYKTAQRGSRLIVADRWYPSSKTCSGCGVAKAKLPLGVRVFACDHCGLVLDRDDNAALNLAALAARNTGTGSGRRPGPPPTRSRSLVEPTRRPAPPAPAARRGRGGQVAQPCRTSGRQKRETVLKPKPSSSGDETDLPGRNARNTESCCGSRQRNYPGRVRDKTQANSAAAGDRLIRAGAIVFFVGAVATLVTVAPFLLGTTPFPTFMFGLSMLMGVGFLVAGAGVLRSVAEGRRQARAATAAE